MIILGISLGFNSSASLWRNNKCLASLSQERITGIRNTKEVPVYAAKKCFEIAGVEDQNIIIAYSHYEGLSFKYLEKNFPDYISEEDCPKAALPEEWLVNMIEKATGKTVVHIARIEHHNAHAYSAYAVYGKSHKRHTTLTMDGFGDGYSARLCICDKDKTEIKAELPLIKSPALYYQFVTGALGFKEHQHEGKITGLSTGNYIDSNDSRISDAYDFFMELWLNGTNLKPLDETEKAMVAESTIIDFDKFLQLKKTIYAFVKNKLHDDYSVDKILGHPEAIAIAVAVQRFAEEIVQTFLFENRGEITDELYLAGGMFANVAINRMFGSEYKHVYISPAMGDEGTAMGAAACLADINFGLTSKFHPEYIIDGGLPIETQSIKNIDIVNDLIDCGDNIVHLCTGRSEFGPRALMHRSSLFPATLKRETDKLNHAMHRSEFMPYAPVCRAEDVNKLFVNWKPFEKSLHFMTVALVTTTGVICKYPAGVHKDGTCRVQVVHKDVPCEKQAWDILDLYRKKSGNDIMINTSFNMHNEPTCCTKEQCISAWERSGGLGKLYFKTEER
jgi:carbamoyltransferase